MSIEHECTLGSLFLSGNLPALKFLGAMEHARAKSKDCVFQNVNVNQSGHLIHPQNTLPLQTQVSMWNPYLIIRLFPQNFPLLWRCSPGVSGRALLLCLGFSLFRTPVPSLRDRASLYSLCKWPADMLPWLPFVFFHRNLFLAALQFK